MDGGVESVLQDTKSYVSNAVPQLCVGYNRRRAPQILEMKEFWVRMTAASDGDDHEWSHVPPDHWTGRRYWRWTPNRQAVTISPCSYFVGCQIKDASVSEMKQLSKTYATEEKSIVQLTFEDGSLGTILYLANGHSSFPKERIEVFSGGRILQLDNFQRLHGFGWPKLSKRRLMRQDKGQDAFVLEFLSRVEEVF